MTWAIAIYRAQIRAFGGFVSLKEAAVFLSEKGLVRNALCRDYNIRELALFDLPAVIEHVKAETGYSQVAFIGHSQGNATMFCTLGKQQAVLTNTHA